MKRALLILIIICSLTIAGDFSIGLTSDLLQQSRNEFSWNYERIDPTFGNGITTDTIYTMQLGEIKPAFGVFIGYENQLYNNINYCIEYAYSKMKYDYSFSGGAVANTESFMKWSRHTLDVGFSYTLHELGASKASIGIGEALTFVTPLISSNDTDMLNADPNKGYTKNSLSLNDRRGEYLFLMYQDGFFDTSFKYQIKMQLNYIEATFIDWFAPTIRFGIVF